MWRGMGGIEGGKGGGNVIQFYLGKNIKKKENNSCGSIAGRI